MSRIQVVRTDRFDDWRIKSNRLSAAIGDPDAIIGYAAVTFNGLIGRNHPQFQGTPATFSITKESGVYSILVTLPGDGYDVGDIITIKGGDLGGVDDINDLVMTVDSLTVDTGVATVSFTGTPASEVVAEFNQIRTEIGTGTLTTSAQNLYSAINEIDAQVGDDLLTTVAGTVTAAINELDSVQGNNLLTTNAATLTAAVNELHADIGNLPDLNTTATDLVEAINEIKVSADDIQAEMGGDMADYAGPDTTILSALNNLYNASNLLTLDAVYVRRNGTLRMDPQAVLQLSDGGIDSVDANFLIKTAGTSRITINGVGNVGVGKGPSTYKMDVQGSLNATTVRYNTEDTDTRYLRTNATSQTVNTNVTFEGPVTFNDPVNIGSFKVGDDTLTIEEWVQDRVGAMFTGNNVSGGISSTYDDVAGSIALAIANDSHTHVVANITDFIEQSQDLVGAMFTNNIESGISLTYDDNAGKINVDVNDFEITLGTDLSGSVAINNLGNATLNATLVPQSVRTIAGAMFADANNTGISSVYDGNKVSFALTADPSIQLTGDVIGSVTLTNLATGNYVISTTVDPNLFSAGNVSGFEEQVEDIVGAMFDPPNVEAGVNVYYDDDAGKINVDVNDFTVTLIGDVTGTATLSNLQSVQMATTVDRDGHDHDNRYYTKGETDAKYLSITAKAADANTLDGQDGSYYRNASNINDGTLPTARLSGTYGINISGTAATATNATNCRVDADNSTNSGHYVIFTGGASGNQRLNSDTDLKYNPSSNTLSAGVFSGRATTANYADLAEKYLADKEYEPGTVMAVGGDKEVTAATETTAHSVLGVVSEFPGVIMNSELVDGTFIALKGRVPVFIDNPVRKGDRLAASATAGVATVNNSKDAWTFGIALHDSEGPYVEAIIL